MSRIRARCVLAPDGPVTPGEVVVDEDRIASVHPASGPVPDRVLVPGFVDLQVNGHGDVDVSTASTDDLARLDGLLVDQGVTTWCPTLTSAPLDSYADPLERLARAAAREGPHPTLAGVHLEGPFLDPGHAGAHPPEALREVDLEWLAALPDVVRLVTLAPERARAVEAVEQLTRRGVTVALGHSGASTDETTAAVEAGARLVTHLFDAMAPFHHRRPGIVGAALTDDRVGASLIADLHHVHPRALALAFRAKGPRRVALVTDAVAPESRRFGRPVHGSHSQGAPTLADGTLAGSTLTMDTAVRNTVDGAGVSLEEAVAAASTTPAALLGLHDRGRIAPGTRADLVALDSRDLAVREVWIVGEPVR